LTAKPTPQRDQAEVAVPLSCSGSACGALTHGLAGLRTYRPRQGRLVSRVPLVISGFGWADVTRRPAPEQVRAGSRTLPLTRCFSAGRVKSALAGCRRLASGLVRRSMDTDRFRSPSDRPARKCGAKVWGVSGIPIVYGSVTFRHAINCFGVRAGRLMASVHRQTANSTCTSSCGRATALRLASSLAVSQPRWGATTSRSRTPRRRRANGHERRRPDVELLYLAAV
jgi:hypothetical protein